MFMEEKLDLVWDDLKLRSVRDRDVRKTVRVLDLMLLV